MNCPECGWILSDIGLLGTYKACLGCFRIFDCFLDEKRPKITVKPDKPREKQTTGEEK